MSDAYPIHGDVLVALAMDVELDATIKHLDTSIVHVGKTNTHNVFRVSGKHRRVYLTKTGIGLIQTAHHLTLALDHLLVDSALMLGVGGALDPSLNLADGVVGQHVLQHDALFSHDQGMRPLAPGERAISGDGTPMDPHLLCHPEIVKWLKALGSRRPDRDPAKPPWVEGQILSGSEFVGSIERKRALKGRHAEALLVDMESAALAQICQLASKPFGVFRSVVDRAEPEKSVSEDYNAHLDVCAAQVRCIVEHLLMSA